MPKFRRSALFALVLGCAACSSGGTTPADDGGSDAATSDSGTLDAGGADAGDAGEVDAGDAGEVDAGPADGGGMDSGTADAGKCTPTSCEAQGINCGTVDDGSGGCLDCGACPSGETCGGGGIDHVCGKPACVPKTCNSAGAKCGALDDGCGHTLDCGGCNLPETCGGTGTANQCGTPASCTSLCLQQQTCANPNVTTTVTGTVYAPNGVDPIYGAYVYVPNSVVAAFTPGVTCGNCGAPPSGDPLVHALSGIDGTFTLRNVPVGTNIPLVIQLGRWRRQLVIASVNACVPTAIPASQTRLPRNQGEGDIPLMAFATGAVDALECVLRKIGVDDAEFTAPSGGGRIHLYEGLTDHNSQNATASSWASGGAVAPGSPSEDQLWSTSTALNRYDLVFFPCQADQGDPALRSAAAHQNLVDYVKAGGRVFATHFSYIWLYTTPPFSSAATWNVEQHPSPANQIGYVETSFPKGQALAQWLLGVGASTTLGQIPLQVIRHDYAAPVAPSQSWLNIDDDPSFPGASVDFTFNTPIGTPAAQQCGRVVFNDFHVENTPFASTIGAVFPSECAAGAMTPQEKLLEAMIFDLANCISTDQPSCTRKSCTDQGIGCGPAGDGCGGLVQCGKCAAGQTCSGAPSQCEPIACTPKTCQDQGFQCGAAGDGCGNTILCGACPSGQTCGGGGQPYVCGTQSCAPMSCMQQGIHCGPAGDGCGGTQQCGTCPTGQSCGAGGQAGVCAAPQCTPGTCTSANADCGPIADGCGNILQCGACEAPSICGGGGVANRCGGFGPG